MIRVLIMATILVTVSLGCHREPGDVSGLQRVGGSGGAEWHATKAHVAWLCPPEIMSLSIETRTPNKPVSLEIGPCEVEITDIRNIKYIANHERIPLIRLPDGRWIAAFTFTGLHDETPLTTKEKADKKTGLPVDGIFQVDPPASPDGKFFDCVTGQPNCVRVIVTKKFYFEWNPKEISNLAFSGR